MLPNKISATNIELLLRNPYGFYAKNILHLRKLDNIFDKKLLSKFGNFIHQIIERYTLEFDENISDKYNYLLEIGKAIAKENYNDESQVNLWWPKFEAIANEFVDFDLERREDSIEILPEIYGEMTLEIENNSVTITAIADRLERKKDNKIHILDYKTGSLPTKNDIAQGISVQLIIEALIAEIGGFKNITGNIEELIYVKISSSVPYISTTHIQVSDLNLKAHKEGLIKILSYYSKSDEFKVNNNSKFAPRYDDYAYLARKS